MTMRNNEFQVREPGLFLWSFLFGPVQKERTGGWQTNALFRDCDYGFLNAIV